MEIYDSTPDTLLHIKGVSNLLIQAATELLQRAKVHDDSKLVSPEKELFDELTPRLKHVTYNSEEYKAFLAELKPALDHHYAKNNHHPEHYPSGIDGMNLFDVMEMFFDWRASSQRHTDGNICKSIAINQDRFSMSDQLTNIFNNTVKYLGW